MGVLCNRDDCQFTTNFTKNQLQRKKQNSQSNNSAKDKSCDMPLLDDSRVF